MKKFLDVDIIETLRRVMLKNTEFWQSDFEIDTTILKRAGQKPNPENRRFIWFSRPNGTFCAPERDVFQKGTGAYITYLFYEEQTHDRIFAFDVEIKRTEGDSLYGNLYELDYRRHTAHVRDVALPAKTATLIFADGHTESVPFEKLRIGFDITVDGRLVRDAVDVRYEPENEQKLEWLLCLEHQSLEKRSVGTIKIHI